jgi:DNA helicase II / ATP-dependent DNA helicase PcrA
MSSLLEGLNPEQTSAVTAGFTAPILVLAGAGCGKTTVLTRRIGYLAENFCPSSDIVALTFTRAAAREMAERVAALIQGKTGGVPLITTFHAYSLRVLLGETDGVRNYTRLGYFTRPRIVSAQSRLRMMAQASTREERIALGMDVLDLDSFLMRRAVFPEKARALSPELADMVSGIEARYASAKKKQGLWDFPDFISGALTLFKTYPAVVKQYADCYRVVLVDEFQDTNPLQIRLVKHLIVGGKSFFAVGDDDQAIYGFQGSDRRTTICFADHFPGPLILKLQTNYRSTPAILASANRIFRKKPAEYRKVLQAGRSAAMNRLERRMPEKKVFEDEPAMVSWVIDTMQKMNAGHGVGWSSIALLFRLNQTRERFEKLLAREPAMAGRMPRLLTVHSAKGLEFPAVFLCDLEEGIFPDARGATRQPSWCDLVKGLFAKKKEDDDGFEEEKRLFYVGVTRAKRFLWLVSAKKKELYGRTRKLEPSRFLKLV